MLLFIYLVIEEESEYVRRMLKRRKPCHFTDLCLHIYETYKVGLLHLILLSLKKRQLNTDPSSHL